MSSPAVLDFAKYLAPLSGVVGADPAAPPNPAGIDLRANRTPPSLYDQIRDARNAASSAEYSTAAAGEEGARPDWKPVLEQGGKALTEKTKDLEIAAYLIEALLRLHGFAGLRDGFRLARELIEKYWDQLYPLPDEEGIETRINALAQVLRAEGRVSLLLPIARVPLTEAVSPAGRLTLELYQKALKLNQITDPKLKQRQIDQGAVPLDAFQQAVEESSVEFFVKLVADLTGSLDELTKLGLTLDERAGSYSPATSNLRTQITACLDAVRDVAKTKLPAAAGPAAKETKEGAPVKPAGAAAPPAEALDVIRDREDAFRVLGKVAEFFKKTEPHSVVSYALDQVVRWGRMPLPELLSELIPDDGPRKNFFLRVGIKPAEPAKGEGKK